MRMRIFQTFSGFLIVQGAPLDKGVEKASC